MWQALIGLAGAIIGALAAILAVIIKDDREQARREKDDEGRCILLRQMLDKDPTGWRKMTTLSRVIGADRDETARLLIKVGARGNEKEEGNDVWGYIKNHPLPEPETAQSK